MFEDKIGGDGVKIEERGRLCRAGCIYSQGKDVIIQLEAPKRKDSIYTSSLMSSPKWSNRTCSLTKNCNADPREEYNWIITRRY